ncbi:Hypothetical protein FKW44_015298 [Caligus rogercresseyi]|uniref:Uncharacterized protein n=1 Tax=Caligus rogercresseyi TaxID=217165 RepID=A0A7T8K0I6_CALRO|nr:Hypothetical protein FKW44_015298 [Caligus rogercresseyi]
MAQSADIEEKKKMTPTTTSLMKTSTKSAEKNCKPSNSAIIKRTDGLDAMQAASRRQSIADLMPSSHPNLQD